jgi:hypothetical protein
MSSAHVTMQATVAAAAVTKAATTATNTATFQTSIDVAKSVVGYIPGLRGNDATYMSTVAAANATLAQNRYIAEMNRQCSEAVARDTMRAALTGEVQ